MASGRYSFIDIAVLEEVRVRFAAGEALALLSVDLERVLWANGTGAALFGYDDVESVMGTSPDLGFVARRQIAAVPGFPRMVHDRAVMVRLARGATSRAVPFTVSTVTLPDGVPAILLAHHDESEAGTSERIVAGFREAGYFAGLVDAQASLSATSEGFLQLGITQETLATLVAEVAHEGDRLVKRLIPVREGLIPAGIARLTDQPALHLVIAVDAPIEEVAPVPTVTEKSEGTGRTAAPSDADLPERIDEIVTPAVIAGRDADGWYFSHAEDREAAPVFGKKTGNKIETGMAEPGGEEHETIAPAVTRLLTPTASHTPPNLNAGAVRFSWRTDEDGAFSAISDEFIGAVGSQAADIVGRPFRQVAAQFGLDQDGEIASLLERRDTWSGRTVMWPIAGTTLAAPVDLAALPVYNRARVFEGFRGFGVVRMGDASHDPQARGQALDQKDDGQEAPAAAIVEADEPEEDGSTSDPFRNEVPVIEISDRLKRRASDKIIRLAEHRPPQPEPEFELQSEPEPKPETPPKGGLSAVERSAFEEIRARLRRETAPIAQDETEPVAPEPIAAKPENAQAENTRAEDEIGLELQAISEEKADPVEEAGPVDEDGPVEEAELAGEAMLLPGGKGERRPLAAPELISALPLPLLVHAGDTLHFANREFLDLTGYASLEQISREGGLDRLFVEEAPDEEMEAGSGHKLRLRTLGGEVFPVDAHLQSVRWQEGTALLLALRRVEELQEPEIIAPPPMQEDQRDLALAGLERQMAELRTIIDTATDGVVLIAPDGTIRNISRPAEALFGFDSAEVEGKPFATLLAMESRKSARDYLAGLAEHGVASLLNDGREVIGREREGRFIPLFMTIGRLPGDSGYCAVVRDITHFKRAEEEMAQARARAERASSQKTEFLARVSHEIRTPLNAIIGFSELMMDEKFGPIGSDRYRDYLRDINRSGNHVLDLVNDLLDISKIEAGEQEMNYEAVSLNEALAEAVAMMQPQANRERVIIRSSLASRLPEVVADLRSVRQIALNLLSNAVRYTQAGGQVIVSTAYEMSGDVALRVRDTGIGMTLAEIDQALKPFKQINALKRGRHDGTGLGLPLTKAMVEANRARFSISSTPGEGTLVEIVFPSTRVLAG